MSHLQSFMLAVVMSLLFCGCTETGPEGPAGAQGAAGAQGPEEDKRATGAPGPQGATGTANVIYSDWLQIKFVDFKAQLDAPKLTDQIHEQGEVVVFFATNTAPGASAYRLNYYANPLTWVSFYITVGKINFIAGDTYNTHTYYVRYILIPGGVHARVADRRIDQDDYQAICRYYGVPE